MPGYIRLLPELKAKGVDQVIDIGYNDAFVMAAWGKANGVKGEDIVCAPLPYPTLPSPPSRKGKRERESGRLTPMDNK